MFYLVLYSTHFYIQLYGVEHKVKDQSDGEKENQRLLLHGLFFPISSKDSFICIIPPTMTFGTPVIQHWLEREIAQ